MQTKFHVKLKCLPDEVTVGFTEGAPDVEVARDGRECNCCVSDSLRLLVGMDVVGVRVGTTDGAADGAALIGEVGTRFNEDPLGEADGCVENDTVGAEEGCVDEDSVAEELSTDDEEACIEGKADNCALGISEGTCDGVSDNSTLGGVESIVGEELESVGTKLGDADVCATVACDEGKADSCALGSFEGNCDGVADTSTLGVMDVEGDIVGDELGNADKEGCNEILETKLGDEDP